jgi:hypothetical protein
MSEASMTFHPTLEQLEDRSTPAAIGDVTGAAAGAQAVAPPALSAQAQTAPAVIDLQNGLAQAVATVSQAGASVASTSFTTQAPGAQIVGVVPPVANSALTLPPGVTVPPTVQSVYGFQGRYVLPGTGVDQRVAVGNGPLTQPPGLYLSGGGNTQPNLLPARQAPRPPSTVPLSAESQPIDTDSGTEASGDGASASEGFPTSWLMAAYPR